MATVTSAMVQELYTDIVADIKSFVDDATLLNNPQFMMAMFDIAGSAGNTVRVPVQNAFTDAGEIQPGNSIISVGGEYAYNPTSVDISMKKFGVGTDIYEDALEDGGIALVRSQLLNGLAGGLAQAIDKDGFATLTAAGTQDGNASITGKATIVMSPQSLAMASKRQPTVKTWFDPDTDSHQFRATSRTGFAAVPNGTSVGVRLVDCEDVVGTGTVSLADYAKAVANLRAGNHPTMQSGFYAGFINPTAEFALASELNGLAGTTGTVGDLSDLGNQALVSALVGQAVGIAFARTNNLTAA
jgi:hypothetical protein